MIKWIIAIVVYLAIGIPFGAVNFKITMDAKDSGKFTQDESELPVEYMMFWLTMLIWPAEIVYVAYHICKRFLGNKEN